MSFTVDSSSLSYALAKDAAPTGWRVESSSPADIGPSLPLSIVSASAPISVANGRAEASASFTIVASCYSRSRAEARAGCDAIYAGFFAAWRSHEATPYGWISRISNDSQQPTYVASGLEADDVHRFDCTLSVIARH